MKFDLGSETTQVESRVKQGNEDLFNAGCRTTGNECVEGIRAGGKQERNQLSVDLEEVGETWSVSVEPAAHRDKFPTSYFLPSSIIATRVT